MDDYHRGDDLGVAQQADNLRLLGASRTIRVMVPVAVVLAVVGVAGFNLARSETLRVLWLFLATSGPGRSISPNRWAGRRRRARCRCRPPT